MKRTIFVIAILSMLIYGCSGKEESKGKSEARQEPVKVEVAKAEVVRENKVLEYSGTVEAMQTIPLSFESIGRVDAVYVDEGDFVDKGQLLARVERGSLESSYKGALAKYEQAVDAQNRLKSVYEKGSLPEIKWVEVNTQVAQAKAMLDVTQRNLENCEMTAPTSGIIGSRNIEPGMTAMQVQSPLEIVKIDEVLVKISVPENEIGYMKKGMEATIIVGALQNQKYTGVIEKVGVVAHVLSRTYAVKVRVENKDMKLKPGMVCEVTILFPKTEEKLLVPYSSVEKDATYQEYVYVADKSSGLAERRYVEIDDFVDEQIAIKSGLNSGELVVVAGNQKITDGTPVVY